MGGPSFADLAVPRRTLYLQSVRTGPGTTDFGRVFDRADPGSIVGKRGESVVAPQALFFLNDPFVNEHGSSARREDRERRARGRPSRESSGCTPWPWAGLRRREELDARLAVSGRRSPASSAWERYCQLIVCQNEFLYID